MDKAFAQKYARLEETHWWFRARRIILSGLLRSEVQWRPGLKVLEVGVGPGINLYSLYPNDCSLEGFEPDEGNAGIAARRGQIPVSIGTVEQMPDPICHRHYDLITMFDVLEHIRDDVAGLRLIRDRLVDHGYLVLTVPACQWLWSNHDAINHHFRRYSRAQLLDVLAEAGFKIQRATYFNSLLFPMVAAARFKERLLGTKTLDNEKSAGFLDSLFYRVFASESRWLRRRSFPIGVSLFAVARKQ